MATGYTHCIGEGVSFKTFVLKCARARGMGACIMQRDDPSDEPPKLQKPSNYSKKSLIGAKKQLTLAKKMSDKQAVLSAKKSYDDELAQFQKALDDSKQQQEKYKDMLSKVKKWKPPTKNHIGFKNFMIDQIKQSIVYDDMQDYCLKQIENLKLLSADEYRINEIRQAENDIKYHTKDYAEEVKRTKERNDWIKALFTSLKNCE
jgi:hypothetical protein